MRAINLLTQHELCALVSKYARMTRTDLQTAALSTTTPMIEVTIASIFAKAATLGDSSRLDSLLNRAIGKAPVIPDEVDPDGELGKLSDEELAARIRRFLPRLEKGA